MILSPMQYSFSIKSRLPLKVVLHLRSFLGFSPECGIAQLGPYLLCVLFLGTVHTLCILNLGTATMLCIFNVGTVPTLCILNIGTVPTFSPSLNFLLIIQCEKHLNLSFMSYKFQYSIYNFLNSRAVVALNCENL